MVCKMLSSKGTALISANPLWVRWQSTQEAFLQPAALRQPCAP